MTKTQPVITPLPDETNTAYLLDPSEGPTGVFTLEDVSDEIAPEDRGRVIAGRYEIIERIGEGGMGQVLHVRHRRLGKSFALKLMHAEFTLDEEARTLFKKEARIASALCHPNIVSVVDFGDDPDWGLFITMELLEGESLLDRVRGEERLPLAVVCDVAAQVAAALAHSHELGVIHADVKAENVLCVSDDQSQWNIKLLDFGTAQIATRSNAIDQQIAGTPAYMAPERISGQPPHPSNDIYALGVLLYEMLTGITPFRDDNPTAVLQRHLDEQPPPVDATRGEVLDSALVAIVDKALAKDPGQRYATAEELADDLSSYMTTIGVRQRELEQRVGIVEYTREEAAADAFDALGISAAGLDVDGTIRIANRAFAQLIKAESAEALKGRSVLATALGTLHTEIREDLRLVAMTGKLVRRRVRIVHPDASESLIRLVMTPATGRCGSCMLAIHPLPAVA